MRPRDLELENRARELVTAMDDLRDARRLQLSEDEEDARLAALEDVLERPRRRPGVGGSKCSGRRG